MWLLRLQLLIRLQHESDDKVSTVKESNDNDTKDILTIMTNQSWQVVVEMQMVELMTLGTFKNEIVPSHPIYKTGMIIDLDLLLNNEIALSVINDASDMQPTTHILEYEDI